MEIQVNSRKSQIQMLSPARRTELSVITCGEINSLCNLSNIFIIIQHGKPEKSWTNPKLLIIEDRRFLGYMNFLVPPRSAPDCNRAITLGKSDFLSEMNQSK